MDWIDYGETGSNWDKIQTLQALFNNQMTAEEQAFCNDIRHLYWISQVRGGGQKTDGKTAQLAGSYVFCGAHVVVRDQGVRHAIWKGKIAGGGLGGANRQGFGHGSSHYSGKGDQWEVHLPKTGTSLGCVLFGIHPDGHSWFQNESWAAWRPGLVGGSLRWAAHGVFGWGAHKLSGNKQVGAYGYCLHTEKNQKELVVTRDAVPETTLYGN
jgi:hypothetical protein